MEKETLHYSSRRTVKKLEKYFSSTYWKEGRKEAEVDEMGSEDMNTLEVGDALSLE